MFNHLNVDGVKALYENIIAFIGKFRYMRFTADENSAFFGGKTAPYYIPSAVAEATLEAGYLLADSDSVFSVLEDSGNNNMLAASYLGTFTSSTVLKEGRIIRAKEGLKIKKVTLTSGAVWAFQTN